MSPWATPRAASPAAVRRTAAGQLGVGQHLAGGPVHEGHPVGHARPRREHEVVQRDRRELDVVIRTLDDHPGISVFLLVKQIMRAAGSGLQGRIRLLTGGSRTAVPRQQTLEAPVG